MKVEAKAPRGSRAGLTAEVATLKMTATDAAEIAWFAELFRAICTGGTLTIKAKGRKGIKVELSGMEMG